MTHLLNGLIMSAVILVPFAVLSFVFRKRARLFRATLRRNGFVPHKWDDNANVDRLTNLARGTDRLHGSLSATSLQGRTYSKMVDGTRVFRATTSYSPFLSGRNGDIVLDLWFCSCDTWIEPMIIARKESEEDRLTRDWFVLDELPDRWVRSAMEPNAAQARQQHDLVSRMLGVLSGPGSARSAIVNGGAVAIVVDEHDEPDEDDQSQLLAHLRTSLDGHVGSDRPMPTLTKKQWDKRDHGGMFYVPMVILCVVLFGSISWYMSTLREDRSDDVRAQMASTLAELPGDPGLYLRLLEEHHDDAFDEGYSTQRGSGSVRFRGNKYLTELVAGMIADAEAGGAHESADELRLLQKQLHWEGLGIDGLRRRNNQP